MENNKVLTITLIVAGFLIGVLSLMIYFRKNLVRVGGKLKDYLMGDVEEEKVEEKPPQGRYDPVLIQTLLNNIDKFEEMKHRQKEEFKEMTTQHAEDLRTDLKEIEQQLDNQGQKLREITKDIKEVSAEFQLIDQRARVKNKKNDNNILSIISENNF